MDSHGTTYTHEDQIFITRKLVGDDIFNEPKTLGRYKKMI